MTKSDFVNWLMLNKEELSKELPVDYEYWYENLEEYCFERGIISNRTYSEFRRILRSVIG